jgi:3-methyladenine DNA glycosylase AlkC
VRKFASDANITSLTVEFGTYPVREVLRALQADNWLYVHGDVDSKLGREIKADVRLRLYPDEDDWKEMVWVRARQIVRRALRGLAKSSQ